MIYRDDPEYKPLQEKAHALSLEVSQLTLDLDEMSRAYYCQGIPATQAERSDIQAKHVHSTTCFDERGNDIYAATRRAIVRAAAEIGRTL